MPLIVAHYTRFKLAAPIHPTPPALQVEHEKRLPICYRLARVSLALMLQRALIAIVARYLAHQVPKPLELLIHGLLPCRCANWDGM